MTSDHISFGNPTYSNHDKANDDKVLPLTTVRDTASEHGKFTLLVDEV